MRWLLWLHAARATNIIYIVVDDLDQMLGSSFPQTTGATPLPKTKRLLVDKGATFANAFAHVPICNPSRACTLTGRYFHNLKTKNARSAMHVDMALVHDFSFAVDFHKAGYATGLFGKYANAMPKDGRVPNGWDAWFANDGGTYMDPAFWVKNVPALNDGRYAARGYSTSIIGNASQSFLERELPARNVLLHVGPKACHAPFLPAPWHVDVWDPTWPRNAPRRAWNRSFTQRSKHGSVVPRAQALSPQAVRLVDGVWRNRWRALRAVDDLVEALVETVDAHGQLDETYFFFTSDHGFHLGQLNLLWDKRRAYDFDTRIPLVVRGPGVRAGRTIDALVTNVDFYPTFLALGGLPPRPSIDGVSLAPLLFGEGATWRTSVPIEHFYWLAHEERFRNEKCVQRCPAAVEGYPARDVNCVTLINNTDCWCGTGDDCYATEDARNNFLALRRMDPTSNLLYVVYATGDQARADVDFAFPHFRELFVNDSWCVRNVREAADPHLLRELDAELRAWSSCAGASCRSLEPAPRRPAHAALKDQVVALTRNAFAHYRRHAWNADELRPLSNTSHNWTRPALGVTLIDAMSTLYVMGLHQEFEAAADHVARHFDPLSITNGFVDVFETTIRVLGGLASAYALSKDERLLDAAEAFADALVPALAASPSGIPFRGLASLRDGVVSPATGATCGAAPAGTLLLEFRAVARLANRSDLEALVLRSWRALERAQGRVRGLAPSKLKMTATGCAAQFVFGNQSKLTVGSGVDSYYEYLLKGDLQVKGSLRAWRAAVRAVDDHLVQVRGPTTFMADLEQNKTLGTRATHLACFWPGLRALEALVDPANGKLALAEALLDACVAAYDATATGLAPEAWHVNADGSIRLGANLRHLLRPETIESLFWMYRATRKQKWLDAAVRLWHAFRTYAPIDGGGLATLSDVRDARSPRVDRMDSWVFSETLKYFYLIFDDADNGTLLPLTDWVLTTEAHPVPRFGAERNVLPSRNPRTWSVDVPAVGRIRPLAHEAAADAVERFAQSADRAGHIITEAAVQAWHAAAVDVSKEPSRPLGAALKFDMDVASFEGDDLTVVVKVPIYRAAHDAAADAAHQVVKSGVARPDAIYRSLITNICSRRRCADAAYARLSIELLPAGVVVLDPWEWPPTALGAAARDLKATTGAIIDEGAFYQALRWFCGQRVGGCRGAQLKGTAETYEVRAGARKVEFDAAPWDWPRTLSTDIAEELYAGDTADFRREKAAGIATKICKGNASCAALPGDGVVIALAAGAAYTCTPREEPSGCVIRAARAAKVLNSSLSDADLRGAAQRALRDVCAVRYCARALPERVTLDGVALQPWDDIDEWAAAHFAGAKVARARDVACRSHRYWCGPERAPPIDDTALVTRARARAGTPARRVYFLHLHKVGGTSLCHLARHASTNHLAAPDRNCNLLGDGPRTLELGAHGYANVAWETHCETRAAYAQDLQFLAVERWFDAAYFDDVTCRARFFFVTCLREPLARLRSHLAFENITTADAMRWSGATDVTRGDPVRRGTAVVDNFYIRSLLGREAFFGIPAGDVTSAHLHRAKATLAQFDAVLILERLDASLRQLYVKLGWCAASLHLHKSKEPHMKLDDALITRNRPDVELYAFARSLAAALEESIPLSPVKACATTSTSTPSSRHTLSTTDVSEEVDRRPVYFLHFQRCGGASLCHMARQDNLLTAPPGARNCALEGDGPKTLEVNDGNAAWASTEGCAERAEAVAQLQFFSVERWFDVDYFASVDCRQKFFFVTCLREPTARLASHLAKVGVTVEDARAWASHNHVETIGRGTAAVDNFYTRSLLGRDAFHGIAAGNVTMSDADRAFAVLEKFDAVLILERLSLSFRQLAKLDLCLPDTLNLCDLRPRHCPAYSNLDEVRGAFGALNAPDAALYVKADRLAAALERDLPAPRRCTARDEL